MEEDSCPGLNLGKKAVGSVPAPAPGGRSLRVPGWAGEGTRPALCVQARRGETWPKESDSGTIRNSRFPAAFEQPLTPAHLQVSRGRGSSLGRAAGPEVWAPRRSEQDPGLGKTGTWSALCRPPPQDPPFSRSSSSSGSSARCPPAAPSHPPSLYSAPSRLFTLPLSLSHHLVYTLPCSPPSHRLAPKNSGCAHLSDPNISAIFSACRSPAPSSLPAPLPSRPSLCSSRPHRSGSLRRASYSCKVIG